MTLKKIISLTVIFILCLIHSLMAQNTPNNGLGFDKNLRQKLKPFPQSPYEGKPSPKFSILGTTKFQRDNKVYPKTKINRLGNPIFNGNNFRVNEVFKQDKNIGFKPRAIQGNRTNDTFRERPKEANPKNIPPEFLKQFNRYQNNR